MTEPTVDILMATYNGARFVAEQIMSIQGQIYRNWRLLVSDDCSTDGTLDVVRRYVEGDSRIEIVSAEMRYGLAKANFMHLLSLSHSDYMMFCDQDDVWLPCKIETLMDAIKKEEARYGESAPLLVFCDMKVVDSDLNVVAESFESRSRFNTRRTKLEKLIALNIAAGCTMLFNLEPASQCLRFFDIDKIERHGWLVMIVASAIDHISYVDVSLNLYRQHGDNEVGSRPFSPVRRASQFGFMSSQMLSSFQQAQMLLVGYGNELSADERIHLSAYCMTGTSGNPIRALVNLFRSHCLKEWPRFLGQIYVAARLPFSNNRAAEGDN